jgi:IS1 family transposase
VLQQVQVQPKRQQRLTVQMDELWSFVEDKQQEQWVWLALDAVTREIVGCTVGNRSGEFAKTLWRSLPAMYRQWAVCYTDWWSSYPVALPSKRHHAVNKESGLTSYIERLDNTLRQRVARLVRKTLSFSKRLDNHIGATLAGICGAALELHSPLQCTACADDWGLYTILCQRFKSLI